MKNRLGPVDTLLWSYSLRILLPESYTLLYMYVVVINTWKDVLETTAECDLLWVLSAAFKNHPHKARRELSKVFVLKPDIFFIISKELVK